MCNGVQQKKFCAGLTTRNLEAKHSVVAKRDSQDLKSEGIAAAESLKNLQKHSLEEEPALILVRYTESHLVTVSVCKKFEYSFSLSLFLCCSLQGTEAKVSKMIVEVNKNFFKKKSRQRFPPRQQVASPGRESENYTTLIQVLEFGNCIEFLILTTELRLACEIKCLTVGLTIFRQWQGQL